MKKALVAFALAAFASTAAAAIAGSAHDLSDDTNAQLSSCQFCHTPHFSNVSGDYVAIPLWNRNTPTTTGYAFYTAVTDTSLTVGAGSYACLSCHDGTADMGDTYRGTKGFPAARTIAAAGYGYANVTNNLQDDHPVGVDFVPGSQYESVANVVAAGLKLYGAGNGTVECGSCHDPHGTAVTGGGSDKAAGGAAYLRVAATAICAECHLK